MRLPRSEFEDLVRQAIDALPEEFLARLDNVDVVVEAEPTPEQLDRQSLDAGETLFGLYEGVPLTERHESYGLVTPDKITIFQRPIEEVCDTLDELVEQVQSTVVHEIAHFFGIGDARLDELGLS